MSSNLKVNSLVPATGTEIGIGTTGGSIDFRCPATFGGNVTIGGTLTYDEVINIDSIGIITARSNIDCNGDLDVDGHTELDNVNIVGVTTTTGNVNVGGELNLIGGSDAAKYIDARTGASNSLIFRSTSGGDSNHVTMLSLGRGASSLIGDLTLGDSSDTSSAAGPEFTLNRNSASPANADYLGQIKFAGRSSTGVQRNYAKITGKILDVTNGAEDGILEFAHIKNGSQTITGRWRSDSLQLLNGTSLTVAGTAEITGAVTVSNNISLGDNDRIIFGDGGLSDAHVRYDGNHLQFGVASGQFRVSADTANFVNYAGSQTLATINSTGVSIPLDLDVDGHTNLDNVSIAGVTTAAGSIVQTSGHIQLRSFSNPTSGAGMEMGYDGTRGVIQCIDRDNSGNKSLFIGGGNVGINEISPSFKLDVNGEARINNNLVISTGNKLYTKNSQGQLTVMGGATYPGGSIKFAGGQSGATDRGTMIFYAGTATSLEERLRITSGGQVRIGNENNLALWGQTNRLQVAGTDWNTSGVTIACMSNSGSANLVMGNSRASTPGGSGGALVQDSRLAYISFVGDDGTDMNTVGAAIVAELDSNASSDSMPARLRFYTGGNQSSNERLRITSSGKIGLNNTSPAYTLDVAYSGGNLANAAVSRFRQTFNNQGDDHTCFIVRHAAARSGQNGVGLLFQNNSGTAVGKIDFGHSTTQYRTSSDYRLKENAVSISDGISRLKTLKPYRFNWIAEKDQPKVDGFFAHEVTAVPESISGTKDEVDSDNNPVYQSIDHSKLVPLLTAALQEEISKREALEARVAALEGS